jgi:predicted NAD-dependent protein-ADP-ribosyltransferase YbiA (DUF1768 family)
MKDFSLPYPVCLTLSNRDLILIQVKKINITSISDDPIAAILSNLAHTPFTYGGYTFSCVEAALQGIKFEDKEQREKVFAMSGMQALKAGREITMMVNDEEEHFVYWASEKFLYNSNAHRLLIASFIREKVRQSVDVQNALMQTKDDFIYHDVGPENPKTSLPEKLFIEILLAERMILLKLFSLT